MKKSKNDEIEDKKPAAKKLKTSNSSNSSSGSVTIPSDIKSNDLQVIRLNYDTYRLRADFYDSDCLDLSQKLLNKYLIRRISLSLPDTYALLVGKIVETEAYLGGTDKASHTFNNKLTDRLKAMYMTAGTAYVYNIYGMYCCLNISAREPGAGVLIRALEPCYGIPLMRHKRNLNADKKIKELTNGPSKLCLAMAITKNDFNEVDLATSENMWLQDELSDELKSEMSPQQERPLDNLEIVSAKRIGIDYAGEEAINKLYRFYIRGNIFVSVKAKPEVVVTSQQH